MSDLKRYELNRSEYGIYMNERAFRGTAINTVGFLLRLPSVSVEELCAVIDRVIEEIPPFGLMLSEQGGEPCLVRKDEAREKCRKMGTMSAEDAAAEWDDLSVRPMGGKMYEFRAGALTEGGSYLIARFHHIILDGYDNHRIIQRILDLLSGRKAEGSTKGTATAAESCTNAESPATAAESCATAADTRYMPPEVDAEENRSFWLNYFYGADFEPSPYAVTSGSITRSMRRLPVGEALTAQIRTYAKACGVTEASVYAAAMSLYLARAAGKKDAVFIMPRLGRSNEAELKRYGCHTMAVPVRVTVEDSMTFRELCVHTMERSREAGAHKDYGIDRILADLRNGGVTDGAISEYTFNFFRTKLSSDVPYDLDISMEGAMHNHLTVGVDAFGGAAEINYDMRDGVYDEAAVRRFHGALLHILSAGMEEPERPVGELEIVGGDESALLRSMKGKEIPVSDADTIPSLFRHAVRRFADAPALYAGEHSYTFAELDRASSRVANALIRMGVKQGQNVMYKLHRDEKLIPVMLGISKAGLVFIPIDPEYPQKRIDYIQKNSGAGVMIVNDPEAESGEVRRSIRLVAAEELLSCSDERDPMLDIPQERPAYCIYTSGTTGTPKGAVLSHRGIANITHPDNNPFNRDLVKSGRGLVAVGSVCFDISLFEFFVPLFNGKFIEFAPERALTDPEALAELIRRHGANMLHCTPSRLSAYLKNAKFSAAAGSVSAILAAGEVLPGSLVEELAARYGIHVYNGYGPTETTIGATITEAGDSTTIGTPIANTGVMILDGQGRLLPYGVTGELYIYGKGLGLGYQNLPEETNKRFVSHYGIPMYRTGDLGRFLPDGRIAYHGRNDSQVKLHGLRIELPEIENCIRSFEGIGGVCVQVRRIGISEHLAAFYCAKEGAVIDQKALKEHLRQRLTYYMVPDIFRELDAIPETPGGKTDLKALAAIPVEIEQKYRAPQTPYQSAVCEAFAAVLGLEKAGLDDNFFDRGGDSLHTAELVYEIEARLPETEPAYEDIFRYPTPELLAQYLYVKSTEKDRKQNNPLEKLDYDGIRQLLAGNTAGGEKPEPHGLGNVLLTGASGFLGIHVLSQLLARRDLWYNVYCLVRPTKRLTGEKRLKSTLFYYEETSCDDIYGERLFALNGDIADPDIFAEPFEGRIDTVINCAADVSHFAYDDKLDRINTGGVRNLLRLCEKHGAALVQVSTISVGGAYRAGGQALKLTERDLFVGQEISNQYILSKYMAEYEALRAAADRGIPVKLMRVGNLQGRISDGEFQMNRRTNAFTRQIISYAKIGKIPESQYKISVNFSPVDDVARMIVALASLPKKYSVFHVFPPEEVAFGRLLSALEGSGHRVEVVSDEAFEQTVRELSETEEGRMMLEGVFVDRPDLRYVQTQADDTFTQKIIGDLGLKWRSISDEYLEKYFCALEALGAFDE